MGYCESIADQPSAEAARWRTMQAVMAVAYSKIPPERHLDVLALLNRIPLVTIQRPK